MIACKVTFISLCFAACFLLPLYITHRQPISIMVQTLKSKLCVCVLQINSGSLCYFPLLLTLVSVHAYVKSYSME